MLVSLLRRFSRRTTILVCVALLGTATPLHPQEPASAAVVADSEISSRIDAYMTRLAASGTLSGTLLVARAGHIVYERAFGMASYETGLANSVATRHLVASVTKVLTAVLTLDLAENGVLSLQDHVAKYIPDFPRGDAITVEHLLRHRSGIPHRVTSDAEVSMPRSAADMVELARRQELLFEPGTERSYSSAGYSVLARVLEIATGERYAGLLRDRILRPAGAVHSESDEGWSLVVGSSADYLLGPDGPLPAQPANFSFLVGAGSVFSTPRDLLAVMTGIDEGLYGNLARQEILGDEGSVYWNGQSFGYRSFVDYYGGTDPTVVFCGNMLSGAIGLVRRDIPRIARGDSVPTPSVPDLTRSVRVTAADRASIEGVYQFRAGQPDSEESLRLAPDGSFARLGSWVLVPVSANRLVSTTDFGTVDMIRRSDGRIRALRWSRGEDTFELPRVRGLP